MGSKLTVQEIKEKYSVNHIWSWSRYKKSKEDLYEFYLQYIANIIPDLTPARYGEMGSGCHLIMEDLYNKRIKYDKMYDRFIDVIYDCDIKGLKYDRCDDEKNYKIKKKYEESLKHFFKHHNEIPHKVMSEQYILTFIGDYLFQGYIDAIHNDNGNMVITDWKTSTIYKGKKLEKEKGQLLMYAMSFSKDGFPVDKIKLRWNFMKYTDVDTTLMNGTKKTRTILRCELGKSLASNCKSWMKKLGYTEEDSERYIDKFIDKNDIQCLPQDLRDKYVCHDCYVYVETCEKELNEFHDQIVRSLDEVNKKIIKYDETLDDNIFWQDITDSHSYFMANLSPYSRKIHRPYDKYLRDLDDKKQEQSLLHTSSTKDIISQILG
jgi:hypothetical protein